MEELATIQTEAARTGNGEAVVAARDVTRTYGEGETAVHALCGVTLDVERGKLTAIMGPSGSGKSTLMHILAALDRPTSGTVVVAGTKPDRGFFDDLLEKVGLSDRRRHRPAELSGGQQQRVAIARALVTRPTVVFADEPTGNLDSKTSGEILDLLRASVQDYGQTLVMVTHEARAAAQARRVLFLADGEIVRDLGDAGEQELHSAVQELTPACRPQN